MNSLEKAVAVGAIGVSGIVGCSSGGTEAVETDSSYVVTKAALPWYETGNTYVRKSREGVEGCIEDDVFQTAVSVGDRVRLALVEGQCMPATSVEEVIEESDKVTSIICEVEGSMDQLEYLDLVFDFQEEDFVGFSLTGESDNGGGDFNVWWELEGDLGSMVNPPVIATREDSELGILNTYQYRLDVPSNLVPFVFEESDQMFSEAFIAANYWFRDNRVIYLGFDNCRVEE